VTISPDNRSWILYTSGSTGQPKGVSQNHRNVLHLMMNYTNALHICRHDRMTLLHSGLTLDIFGALLNGAALYPLEIKQEGLSALADWLVRNGITIYRSFPTTFRQFTDTLADNATFPHVRVVHLGGETVTRRDVERYRKHFPPHCILINHLGSNEAGGMATYYIDNATEIEEPTVPVGYPVPDNQVLLLDQHDSAVGPGDAGEIAVRSRYLALGYWGRPDLTRERFLEEPTGGNERLFLTGDLGRRLPDGCLLHLGRKDFQVKVRGYRVELAEIEAALQAIEGVNEAAVVARVEGEAGVRLVAYVASAKPPGLTITTLRDALAATLPDHMIPSAFVFLDALPLTPNGKVDRRSLPAPERLRPNLDVPFAVARTPIEEELVRIWAEVLDLEQIGVHDPFLDLGGNSLLATSVISRVLTAFQVELPLRTLFESPTVADMALAINQAMIDRLDPGEMEHLQGELRRFSKEEAGAQG
jgi:acyl-coenzyme A synthetase/AMP-(fatty) acid ligase/acyl carrier protein